MENNNQNSYNYANNYNPDPNQNPNPNPDNGYIPYGEQNPYNQTAGGYPPPPNPYGQPGGYYDQNLDKKANTIKVLGITSIVTSIVLSCCCSIVAPVLGIIGLVQANGLKKVSSQLSPQAQSDLKIGKTCSIIGLVLGIIIIIANVVYSAVVLNEAGGWDAFYEEFMKEYKKALDEAQNGAVRLTFHDLF